MDPLKYLTPCAGLRRGRRRVGISFSTTELGFPIFTTRYLHYLEARV